MPIVHRFLTRNVMSRRERTGMVADTAEVLHAYIARQMPGFVHGVVVELQLTREVFLKDDYPGFVSTRICVDAF